MSSIYLTSQSLDVVGVKQVTVSDLVLDTNSGEYVRKIKVYGDPVVNGAPTSFVEIAVRSPDRANLEIQAPGFKF